MEELSYVLTDPCIISAYFCLFQISILLSMKGFLLCIDRGWEEEAFPYKNDSQSSLCLQYHIKGDTARSENSLAPPQATASEHVGEGHGKLCFSGPPPGDRGIS